MEPEMNLNDLREEQEEQLAQVRDEPRPLARNPRLVGPDDFQWWLMLEQQEQG